MLKRINPSFILGTITCILVAISLGELYRITPFSEKYPDIMLLLITIYGALSVVIIQIILLLQEPKNRNGMILLVFNNNKPPSVRYVSPSAIITMCRKIYEMEYKAAYWPIYRCCLLAKQQETYRKLVAEGDDLFSRNESCDKKYIALLKYKEYGGKERNTVYKLSDMPSEIEAARQLISLNSNDGMIFYSAKELAEWYLSLPVQQQNEWAKPVLRFLKDGNAYCL